MDIHVEQPTSQGWEREGTLAASDLDGFSAALVLGTDTVAAGEVALGIARAQARRRRVAVGDCVGALAPIEALLPADGTVHGLVDMFTYGVSLGRAATAIDPARNLYVIPSGFIPSDLAEIIESKHWSRLVSGFRDTEALLLIVARADAEQLASLIPLFDGMVLVGEAAAPANARILGHVQTPRARAAHARRTTHTAHAIRATHAARAPRAPFWVAIAATVLAMVALGWWAVQRQLNPDTTTRATMSAGAVVDREQPDPNSAGTALTSAVTPGDSTAPAAAGVASNAVAPQPSTDPAAEARARVPFAVAMEQFTSTTAAINRVEREIKRGLSAPTYAPIYDINLRRRVFLVISGAFSDSADAAALLRSLRREGVLGRGQGHVVNTPFALLVQSGITPEQESSYLNDYRRKGLPVYTLLQSDGSMNIYAGAFESAEAAEPLLKIFRENGESPSVAQRAGRPRQ